jgi:hypothetical protein
VYRGQPSATRDPRASRAFNRQVAAWDAESLTSTIHRPLNYRTNPPREKGIDLRLAIDFVMMAQRGDYDIGVLFSGDTDLVPALEAVAELKGDASVEVAAWLPDNGDPARPLRLEGRRIRRHLLERVDFEHVRDQTDYTHRGRRR